MDEHAQDRNKAFEVFGQEARYAITWSKLIEMERGYLGMAPNGTQEGDFICFVKWFDPPVVLRKAESHYILVGPCNVLGLMNGEGSKMLETGDARVERIEIW